MTRGTPHHVAVLAGDGVGPEVTAAALAVLEAACDSAGASLTVEERRIGGAAIDAEGSPLTDETLERCRHADAVLLGAVGGPRWDHLRGDDRCEAGLLRLRRGLGVFANIRPVRARAALAEQTPLRQDVVAGADIVVVRELTGGVYFGEPRGETVEHGERTAVDTMRYRAGEIVRVARVGFELARRRRGRLTSVDKANVLATSRLWRDVMTALAAEYPGVALEHQLVDSCAMRLVASPRDFDVIVTENLFGDILSDESAVLAGSLGFLPSASLGETHAGLYEPVHGSAPAIAGMQRANPVGAILSVAMLLRHSLGLDAVAGAVERAVDTVVERGPRTADAGGSARTADVGAAVVAALPEHAMAVSP